MMCVNGWVSIEDADRSEEAQHTAALCSAPFAILFNFLCSSLRAFVRGFIQEQDDAWLDCVLDPWRSRSSCAAPHSTSCARGSRALLLSRFERVLFRDRETRPYRTHIFRVTHVGKTC